MSTNIAIVAPQTAHPGTPLRTTVTAKNDKGRPAKLELLLQAPGGVATPVPCRCDGLGPLVEHDVQQPRNANIPYELTDWVADVGDTLKVRITLQDGETETSSPIRVL